MPPLIAIVGTVLVAGGLDCRGELLALEWRDVDFTGQVLHVRRAWSDIARTTKVPKSGKARAVPMSDDVIAALDRLSHRDHLTGDGDRVFVSTTGGVLDSSSLRKRYAAALERAGLPPLRLHDLRHSFCSLAIRALPVSDVQAIAGHSDIATTSRYLHSVPRPEHAAKLTAAFAGENRASNSASNVDISDVLESV